MGQAQGFGSGTIGAAASEPLPPVSPEFTSIAAILEDAQPGSTTGPFAPLLPPALLVALHATTPTVSTLKQIRTVLERSDVEPEGVVEILSKLGNWLNSE